MVSKIIWSPRALADLRDIARYIGRSSPMTAERFCGKIIAAAESIAEFPRQGRVVMETKRDTVREVILPPFRIAYEIQAHGQTVEIMTIWHSARGAIEV